MVAPETPLKSVPPAARVRCTRVGTARWLIETDLRSSSGVWMALTVHRSPAPSTVAWTCTGPYFVCTVDPVTVEVVPLHVGVAGTVVVVEAEPEADVEGAT